MTDVLPPPPIGPEVDLTGFPFMPLHVRKLRDSRFAAISSGEAFRTGVLLWCAAWHQVPAASLPNDDVELANLAGFGRAVAEWLKVRDGALYGWREHSDGRLYHQVLVEAAHEAWTRREQWQETQSAKQTRQQRWRAHISRLCGLLRSVGVTPPERPTKTVLVELCRRHVPGFVDENVDARDASVDAPVDAARDGAEISARQEPNGAAVGDASHDVDDPAGDGARHNVDAARLPRDGNVDAQRRVETLDGGCVDAHETARDIYTRPRETAKTGTGKGQVKDRDRKETHSSGERAPLGDGVTTHGDGGGARDEQGRAPAELRSGRTGLARSEHDAWRDITECDAQAYERWLEWRTSEHDPVPPYVRVEHAKFLAGKGTPEQQRTFVAKLVRMQFKRLHDPIEPRGALPSPERAQSARQEAVRADTQELERLKASRADRGLADFRDPYPHESAAVYETALRTERNRRGTPVGAPRAIAELVQAKAVQS